jgi:hypothetical protein
MENNNFIYKPSPKKSSSDDGIDDNTPFFWLSLSIIFLSVILYLFYKNRKPK